MRQLLRRYDHLVKRYLESELVTVISQPNNYGGCTCRRCCGTADVLPSRAQRGGGTCGRCPEVLVDAEKQQIKNESVKHWIGELKDVAYDIDDVLDEWRARIANDIGWDDLHHLLCKSIKGKQFLLVLDDVWTEDHEKWNPLMAALNGGARGSRIVVTTCSERVALMMGSTHIHNLGLLSENDSWSLFSGIAFAGREKEERDSF
ncbi:hypothetical protein GIB67_017080 [Kingdonia uniflora]|uniref:Uncharacterized protein n=1 Tax=Kingdonia uniflora TaxID=39325 RepID=A0A7J7NCK0_9MAGN|nr:hypothetical protein GIB67_017080 [Kingdonia uniflora]